jgi:hypothetical protein
MLPDPALTERSERQGKHRAGSWYFSQKAVTPKALTELKASVMGYKVDREQVTSQGTLSLIAGTGAVAV